MSASLQQESQQQHRSKAKRPPPSRKKTLCAQRDAEPPPPGFRPIKKQNEGASEKEGGERREDGVRGGAEETASGDVSSESWPSLHVALSSEAAKKSGGNGGGGNGNSGGGVGSSGGAVGNSNSSSGNGNSVAVSKASRKEGKQAETVSPPPGYAKLAQRCDPPPPSSAPTQRPLNSKTPINEEAFPPLSSKNKTETIPPSAPSKSVGGSKLFEDIRQALDYDKEKFKTFQSNSGWFRSGVLSMKEYDTECRALFGARWSEIGPLVAKAMPQGEKRDELVSLFGGRGVTIGGGGGGSSSSQRQKAKRNKAKKVPNAWLGDTGGGGGGGGRGSETRMVRSGRGGTSEEEYPSLATASKLPQAKSSANNVWKVPVHS